MSNNCMVDLRMKWRLFDTYISYMVDYEGKLDPRLWLRHLQTYNLKPIIACIFNWKHHFAIKTYLNDMMAYRQNIDIQNVLPYWRNPPFYGNYESCSYIRWCPDIHYHAFRSLACICNTTTRAYWHTQQIRYMFANQLHIHPNLVRMSHQRNHSTYKHPVMSSVLHLSTVVRNKLKMTTRFKYCRTFTSKIGSWNTRTFTVGSISFVAIFTIAIIRT